MDTRTENDAVELEYLCLFAGYSWQELVRDTLKRRNGGWWALGFAGWAVVCLARLGPKDSIETHWIGHVGYWMGNVLSLPAVFCQLLLPCLFHRMTSNVYSENNPAANTKCFARTLNAFEQGRLTCALVQGQHAIECKTDGSLTAKRLVENQSFPRSCRWKMAPAGGELCFLSHPVSNKRLQYGSFWGSLSMVVGWEKSEIWRFAEVGDGTVLICPWGHDGYYLRCDGQGNVSTTGSDTSDDVRWRVEKSKDGLGVLIHSVLCRGWYLRFDGANRLSTAPIPRGSSVPQYLHFVWRTEAANRNLFHLRVQRRNFGSSSWCHIVPQGQALVASPSAGNVPKWKVTSTDGSYVFVTQTSSGRQRYLGCSGLGTVSLRSVGARWSLRPVSSNGGSNGGALGSGGVHVVKSTAAGELLLACLADGTVAAISRQEAESVSADLVWSLEPCLPAAASDFGTWAMIGALVGAVLAPYAVVGAVQAAGFGYGGIVGGSMAASLMSMEALATGGGVAAGGVVASLQSIGATGALGLSAASAASAAGAVTGAAVSASVSGSSESSLQTTENLCSSSSLDAGVATHNIANRPFAAWRSWEAPAGSRQSITTSSPVYSTSPQ